MFTQNGQFIVGDKPVHLHGLNWFGFNNGQTMFDGHWNYDPLASDFATTVWRMKTLGFNAVRMPFSFQDLKNLTPKSFTFDTNSYPTQAELVASVTPPGGPAPAYVPLPMPVKRSGTQCNGYLPKTSVFDRFVWVVQFLANNGFYVLIDNHLREDQTALRDTAGWLTQWKQLVTALCRDKVTASRLMIDVLNEPDQYGLNWKTSKPCLADLYLAAMDAIETVAKVQFLIEGAGQAGLNCNWGDGFCTDPNTVLDLGLSDPSPFLTAVRARPYKDRVALAPHVYGPAVTTNMQGSSGADLVSRLTLSFGDKTKAGFAGKKYAVAIGEFGSTFTDPRDVVTMTGLRDYLLATGAGDDGKHAAIPNWFYWCWNANSGDTGGLVQDDWKTIQWDKIKFLQGLGL